MPRSKTVADEEVLTEAIALLREAGSEGLTFAALSQRCGLSTATLVQRFSTKAELGRRALLQAWDHLDATTARLATEAARTPDGAVRLLLELSRQYEGPQTYESGLLLLREDLRDPVLRARGAAWGSYLADALQACFVSTPGAPDGIGRALATHWQGALAWWAFQPSQPFEEHIAENLHEIIAMLVPTPAPVPTEAPPATMTPPLAGGTVTFGAERMRPR